MTGLVVALAFGLAPDALAQAPEPETVPWNPCAWTTVTTSRSEDGKSSTIRTRFRLKGKRIRFESFETDWNGKRLAAAAYDFGTKTVWTLDPARGTWATGPLSLPKGPASGWREAGSEKIAGLPCTIFLLDRPGTRERKGGEQREWRHGRFVMKRSLAVERSSVKLLGMTLPVPGQTQTTEVVEIRKGGVTDADVQPPPADERR